MKNQELITVIVTTYKRDTEIVLRAVNSVIAQTYQNLEIIIVDDSPSSFEKRAEVENAIAKIDDSRVNYVKHEYNLGACAARNTGIKISKGNFIAFLDDDDLWHFDKIEKQIDKILLSECGLVYCRYYIIDQRKNKKKIYAEKFHEGNVFYQLLKVNFIGSTSFPLIRKECFQECGFFDETLKASQDYDMWLRISQKFLVDYIDQPLADYFIHKGESISNNINNRIQGAKAINKKHSIFLKKNSRVYGYRLALMSIFFAMAGQRKDALNACIKGIKLAPFNLKGNLRAVWNLVISAIGIRTR